MGDNTIQVEKYIQSNDSRLNYCFIKKDQLEDKVDLRPVLPDWLDKDLIDYNLLQFQQLLGLNIQMLH